MKKAKSSGAKKVILYIHLYDTMVEDVLLEQIRFCSNNLTCSLNKKTFYKPNIFSYLY